MIVYDPLIQPVLLPGGYEADVLRLDLIHPGISGNKWFKLKNNLEQARTRGLDTIITFGGAFSNHISATASAGKLYGLKTIGMIRGEASSALNPTLLRAQEQGMQLRFVDRGDYAKKESPEFKAGLEKEFGSHYLIPEGGNNEFGIKGCMDIMQGSFDQDYVFCACGTGATYTGILAAAKRFQKVIGISVLKGENNLAPESERVIRQLLPGWKGQVRSNNGLEEEQVEASSLSNAYCFNGYAGFDKELVAFKNKFEAEHAIPLDHIYTAKLFYAVCDLAQNGKLRKGSRSLIIHSGGLQGNKGFEIRYPEAAGRFFQA